MEDQNQPGPQIQGDICLVGSRSGCVTCPFPALTFQVSQWVSSMNGSSDVLSFVQWKPVAYRRSNPALEDATPSHHSDPRPQSGETAAAASGLVRAFYSEPDVFGLNVSFGLAGEPFFNSTKFLSWSVFCFIPVSFRSL